MRLIGLISNKWERRELGRFALGKRCNHKMNTNDTLGRCWVNDNHQTQSWHVRQRRCNLTHRNHDDSCHVGVKMTALITYKPVFAYPSIPKCTQLIWKQWGRENPSEDEEDEEVDHILPGVWHANDFLGNVINSGIICWGLITIHNLLHKAVQTLRTLSSEETSEESDNRPFHLASARLHPLHNYKQTHSYTGLIVILHFRLTNNLH